MIFLSRIQTYTFQNYFRHCAVLAKAWPYGLVCPMLLLQPHKALEGAPFPAVLSCLNDHGEHLKVLLLSVLAGAWNILFCNRLWASVVITQSPVPAKLELLTPTADQTEGLSKEADTVLVPVVSSPGHCWSPGHLSSADTLVLCIFPPSLCLSCLTSHLSWALQGAHFLAVL